jgi:hypothetical protein
VQRQFGFYGGEIRYTNYPGADRMWSRKHGIGIEQCRDRTDLGEIRVQSIL